VVRKAKLAERRYWRHTSASGGAALLLPPVTPGSLSVYLVHFTHGSAYWAVLSVERIHACFPFQKLLFFIY